jgi:hypothetical protein
MQLNIPFADIDSEPLLLVELEDPTKEEFLLFKLYCRVLLNNAKNIIKIAA